MYACKRFQVYFLAKSGKSSSLLDVYSKSIMQIFLNDDDFFLNERKTGNKPGAAGGPIQIGHGFMVRPLPD